MKPTIFSIRSIIVIVGTCFSLVVTTSAVLAQNNCLSATSPIISATSTADEDITNVTVGTLNNSSICGAIAPGAGSIASRYSNYTGSVAAPSAVQGNTVAFSLTMTTCGGSYTNFFQVYIDWNQDSDFLDAGERMYSQAT
ncbi:MAG: hypothetical protein ACKO7B_03070, partial [Flavobacteriales bacterium]